jgi:hypothetical protein
VIPVDLTGSPFSIFYLGLSYSPSSGGFLLASLVPSLSGGWYFGYGSNAKDV